MHQRVARTLRYLTRLINQQAAGTNAAEGRATDTTLRNRRHDLEHVDEYVEGRLLTFPIGETKKADRGVHQAEHNL